MAWDEAPQGYQKPEIVDYGTLVELTAGQGGHHREDGLVKNHDKPDESHPHR